MAGFDDSLVREYFELNGFCVRPSRKHAGLSRRQKTDEPGDLLVINPSPSSASAPGFQLFNTDLAGLATAVIAFRPWHAAKAITPTMIKKGDWLEFIRKEGVEAAKEAFAGAGPNLTPPPVRILVLPGLPAGEPQRPESIALLREQGVDHVLTLRTILENLAQAAEAHPKHAKSDTLQLLRLLRAYDMLNAAQLELFGSPPSSK
jgi:hypothetical protein